MTHQKTSKRRNFLERRSLKKIILKGGVPPGVSPSAKSIILEYVWLGLNDILRSKYKTVYVGSKTMTYTLGQCGNWNYDGSSTGQAPGHASEITLVPVAIRPNPFFAKGKSYLVLCDTYDRGGNPLPSNYRYAANVILSQREDLHPWFGIEQEYFIMAPNYTKDSVKPLAYFFESKPDAQNREGGGRYYCGVGNQHIASRALAEKHYLYCLEAGLNISGINSEVAPSQWEFQIGPSLGVSAADELWLARYILYKLSEEFNVNISFEPKLLKEINGSGLHTNFSTDGTRGEGGYAVILDMMGKLGKKHEEHIAVYGDNTRRLTGLHETSSREKFSFSEGDRGKSVRIPYGTKIDKKGYFEDRRPASNADPYRVTSIIFKTCCLE